ncbi:MAG: HAMP domain-containing sensor histidine kinase [Terracoccus sp.]
MRAGVTRVAVLAVMIALLLFAVPLAVLTRSLLVDRERADLRLTAQTATLRVGADLATDAVELAGLNTADPPISLGVYDLGGRLRSGRGPATWDVTTRSASTQGPLDGQESGAMVSAVPVASGETVVAVVRAAEASSEVWRQVALAWTVLAGLAGVALGVAVLAARKSARRLTAPLELLSAASVRASRGDLSARVPPSRVPEVDQLGHAHNEMLEQIAATLERQRHFSADASHQLRTPLAGLQLELEAAITDAEVNRQEVLLTTLKEVQRLQVTVDSVLQVSRWEHERGAVTSQTRPVAELIERLDQRWHGNLARLGRRFETSLELAGDDLMVPESVLEPVLDVLIENAMTHGSGTVTLTVREALGAVAIAVSDEGSISNDMEDPFRRGESGGVNGLGIGLALARTMTDAVGARLVLTSASPATFTVFVRDADDP